MFMLLNLALTIGQTHKIIITLVNYSVIWMYEQIKELLLQIKHHQHQHKVTIFNKLKNWDNMKHHNFTQGKLIHNLKSFPYFASLQEQFGIDFLIKLIQFLDPYFLRKDRLLVNANQNHQLTQYLLCQGVVTIYQIETNEMVQTEENLKKTLKFHKYLSNGSLISFSQFPENQFQISSHSDCKMLKLPTKKQLDPAVYNKKIIEINQLFSNNPDYAKCRSLFIKCIEKANKTKHISLDYSLGLSPFDFNQLFMKAKIQSYESMAKIYETNQAINSIGLILQGKIVEENVLLRSRKIITYDNAILKMYKKEFNQDPHKVEKNQNLLQEAEWIGLEGYLKHLQTKPFRVQKTFKDLTESENLPQQAQKQPPKELTFHSSKQIRTKQYSSVLWIPIEYFARKFNYQTNYSIVDQWRAMIDIKNQTRAKNDKIHQQIQTQKKQRENPTFTHQVLPKLPGRLEELSHNISDLPAKTDIKTKIIFQKQLQFGKLSFKNVKISDTSLLGITMRRDNNLQNSKIMDQEPELIQVKKFSQFSKSTKNKLMEMPKAKRHLESLRAKKSQSQSKIQQSVSLIVDSSPQDLIMYPQAYEPSRLSPDLKSQLYQAQRALRLEQAQYNLPKKQPAMALELSRAQSIEREIMNQNRLTSIGSKASLICATAPSSPQQIYKTLAEKISFKFPNLDQRLRIQKMYKARNRKYEKVTVKERIQTLRILQEIQRKKRVRVRNQFIKDQISMSQIRRKNSATHRQNFSEQKLSLYI